MNPLSNFRRRIELRHKKIYSADELADILGISVSYFNKLNGGFMPITDAVKNKIKLVLASDK